MVTLLQRLTTPHDPAALLSAVHPRLGARLGGGRVRGRIAEVTPTGIDAAAIRITTPSGFPAYRPGQFVVLGVEVDGVRHQRSFTITSLADRHRSLEVTVQASEGGSVSRHLVRRARAGDEVQLSEPSGDFTLPLWPGPSLFISGGSGITPFVAMLRALARTPRGTVESSPEPTGAHGPAPVTRPHVRPDVVMIHHATTADAVLHGRELRATGAAVPWLRLELVTTRTVGGHPIPGTHLDAERLDAFCPDWRDRETFVCGPPDMLDFVVGHWADAGLRDALHMESFGPPAPSVPSDDDSLCTFGAEFVRSATVADAPTRTSLLDVAESAGLTPASGCRAGVCHTCSTLLCGGTTRDLRDGRLTEAGRHVQLCVSAAASDITLDL